MSAIPMRVEDRFVPFAADVNGARQPTQLANEANLGSLNVDKPQKDAEELEGDWHAEIEVLEEPGPPTEQDVNASALDQLTASWNEEVEADSTESSVDDVSFEDLHTVSAHDLEAASAPHSSTLAATEALKSRADSRKARKLRRMEAGKYRPLAEAETTEPPLQQQVDAQVSTVLEKIKQMEGPSVSKSVKADKKKQSSSASRETKSLGRTTEKPAVLTPRPKKDPWQIQKAALEDKYGEAGWQPRKRLSPDTLDGIRALHASDPAAYSTAVLSEHFKVSADAIRRILRSKWRPNDEESADRKERWEKRGVKKWSEMVDQGVRPPRKWRELGVGSVAGSPEEKPAWKTGGKKDDLYVPMEIAA